MAAMFVLPLALDFKGDTAGGMWQILVSGLSLSAGILFCLTQRPAKASGRFWTVCQGAVLLMVLGSFVSFLLNGTPFENYVRVMLPSLYFALGFLIAATLVTRGKAVALDRRMLQGCVVSCLFTLLAGLAFSEGGSVGDIRYQVLSPVLLVLEALLLHYLLVAKAHKRASAVGLALCVSVQLISVTRSALLGVAIVTVVALWIGTPTLKAFFRRLFAIAIPCAVTGLLALSIASAVVPGVADRWNMRLSTLDTYGVDPTTLSRYAEIREQLDAWSSSLQSILIGKGYGASYGWSAALYDELLATGAFDLTGIEQEHFEFGHNLWVSSLYSGGLLFGLALPFVLLYCVYVGIRTSSKALKKRSHAAGATFFIGRSTLVLVAIVASTIGGNPFGPRYSGLMTGLAIGMLVASRRTAYARQAVPPGGLTDPYRFALPSRSVGSLTD